MLDERAGSSSSRGWQREQFSPGGVFCVIVGPTDVRRGVYPSEVRRQMPAATGRASIRGRMTLHLRPHDMTGDD